jgi:hypothetical protein
LASRSSRFGRTARCWAGAWFRFTDHGKPGESEFRFADIWAKRDGQWRVIFTEVTRLPKK